MKKLKLVWLLYRFVRRLERDAAERDVGASFTLAVEDGPGFDAAFDAAVEAGGEPPKRRRGWEVNYWPNVGEPAATRRGLTAADALAQVLGDR